ncbi:MAG: phenylalanine--tRNA ligase subunit alpha, partial [bacterium]|nr:phenylalanine--tRNA ligase subunit alpha [bacterium]
MKEKILNLKNQAISTILRAESLEELENLRISYLGRKGSIIEVTKELPSLPVEARKEVGRILNETKKAVEE